MELKIIPDILLVERQENPTTLFEFIPDNAIVFADESHVSIPDWGMYRGDYRRKFTLAEHGFRYPLVWITGH